MPGAVGTPTLEAGDQQVVVTWTAPSEGGAVATYEVDIGIDGDWDQGPDTVTGLTELTTTVSGLTNDTSYDFRVRAVNSHGEGNWSDTVTATPTMGVAPGKAGRPEVISEITQVILTWTAPSDGGTVATYEVDAGISGDWDQGPDTMTGLTGSSTTVTSLTTGTVYDFRVRAVNDAGSGEWSNHRSVKVGFGPLPVSTTWSDGVSLGVTLKSYSDLPSYIPSTLDAGGGSATVEAWGSSPRTIEFTKTGEYDITLTWDVDATTGLTYEFTSDAPPPLEAPGQVGQPSLTAGDTQVEVIWSAPSDGGAVATYEVDIGIGGDWDQGPDPITGLTGLSTTVTNLTNDTTYDFRVSAVNATGNGDWSDTASATPTEPTPIPITPPNVSHQWPDNASITVTLRVYQNKPSFVPSSVDAGGGSWTVTPWDEISDGSTRTMTFSRTVYEDIVLKWWVNNDGTLSGEITDNN